ncbi:hypothetical protein WK64_31965 [Burkholderia ubonensis]|nr:hypothetical protein WK64_31965 [Burkholderia ubonensis]
MIDAVKHMLRIYCLIKSESSRGGRLIAQLQIIRERGSDQLQRFEQDTCVASTADFKRKQLQLPILASRYIPHFASNLGPQKGNLISLRLVDRR